MAVKQLVREVAEELNTHEFAIWEEINQHVCQYPSKPFIEIIHKIIHEKYGEYTEDIVDEDENRLSPALDHSINSLANLISLQIHMPKRAVAKKITRFFQTFSTVPVPDLVTRFLDEHDIDASLLEQKPKKPIIPENMPRYFVSSLEFNDRSLKALRLTILKPLAVSYAKWCTRCYTVYNTPNCSCGIGIRCSCGGRTRYGICQKCHRFTYRITSQIIAVGCDQTGTILLKFNGKVATVLLGFDGITLIKTMSAIQKKMNVSPHALPYTTATEKLAHLRGKEIFVAGRLIRYKFNPQNTSTTGFPCLQVRYFLNLDEIDIKCELDFLLAQTRDRQIPKNVIGFAECLDVDKELVDRLTSHQFSHDPPKIQPAHSTAIPPAMYKEYPLPSKRLLISDLFNGTLKTTEIYGKNYNALFIPKISCRTVRATIVGVITKKPRTRKSQTRFNITDGSTDMPLPIILRRTANSGPLYGLVRHLRKRQLIQAVGRPLIKNSYLIFRAEGLQQVSRNFIALHYASCMHIPLLFNHHAGTTLEVTEERSQEVMPTV